MGLRLLDRYVLRSWFSIFVLTALGFPLVSIIINMTDNLEKLLDRGLTLKEIVVSYVYARAGKRLPGDARSRSLRHRLHRGNPGDGTRSSPRPRPAGRASTA